jgi:epoxyqueuosine reductase
MPIDLTKLLGELRHAAGLQGARVFGVADLEPLKARVPDLLARVPGEYARAAVLGIRLERAVLDGIADRPTPLYMHHYRQVNYQLDRAAFQVADRLQEAGFRALAVPASQIVCADPMLGHVSHKLLGWAAGIGHIGRCSLLVHPQYGAQARYVSVLTDAPLPAAAPYQGDCGSCRACVALCPAGAIRESKDDFDLGACQRKLAEFSRLPFIGQHICGVCVRACAGAHGRDSRTGLDLQP